MSSGRYYTDEEWAQWRREQEQNAPPAGPAVSDATTTLLALPAEWKVVISPPGNNQPHPPSHFNVLQRDANRMLRKMYTQWQNEVGELSSTHTAVLTNAVGNQAVSNMALLNERQSKQELESTISNLRAELDQRKADYEEYKANLRSELAEGKAKYENDKKDLEKTQEELKRQLTQVKASQDDQKRKYDQVQVANGKLQQQLEQAQRELGKARAASEEFKGKCDVSFRKWAARRDELKAQVLRLQGELALFKDRGHYRDMDTLILCLASRCEDLHENKESKSDDEKDTFGSKV